MNKTHRKYCFTIHNYSENDWKLVKELGTEEGATFVVASKERGENRTLHIQGFVNYGLSRGRRFRAVQYYFGGRAHLEVARGTDAENERYCTKEPIQEDTDNTFVWGTAQTQGGRSDLDRVCAELVEHREMSKVARDFPDTYVQNYRGLKALLDITNTSSRDRKTTVLFSSENQVSTSPRWPNILGLLKGRVVGRILRTNNHYY